MAKAKVSLLHSPKTLSNFNDMSARASVASDSPAHLGEETNNLTHSFENIKLPKIQLPKFDGNYECWLEYRDSFESLINQNSGISSIQKFHYLFRALITLLPGT